MVVLSAAIVTPGKTLLARQYVEITRLRVESLLSTFPKLVAPARDHTFIETETVRYVYQPMEPLYLVLVTNKSSNILEDLETLRLLVKVVQDCCEIAVNEQHVLKKVFAILGMFDEVISFGGHRESVTLPHIKECSRMYSYEEQMQREVENNKINEAMEIAKRKEAEIANRQIAKFFSTKEDVPEGRNVGGHVVVTDMNSSSFQESMSGGGEDGKMMIQSFSRPGTPSASAEYAPYFKPSPPTRGMVLAKQKPCDGFADPPEPHAAAEKQLAARELSVVETLLDPVQVEITEIVVAERQVNGGLKRRSCSGELKVTVLDAFKADLACFKLSPQHQSFRYIVHPNLSKLSYADNILELRDPHRAFSANTPVSLVKWQSKCIEEDTFPVFLSCWPTPEAANTRIAFELELANKALVLEEVCIRFQVPVSVRPNGLKAQPGKLDFDAESSEVIWFIPRFDSGELLGNMEFTAACDSASLTYSFEATRRGHTQCPIDILQCYHQKNKADIGFIVETASVYQLKCGV